MFPLDKQSVVVNPSSTTFLDDYSTISEIPLGVHPGAFGTVRKNHIHEGIDLYCNPLDQVRSMYDGDILYIGNFTGALVGSPWWNDTQCILVAHRNERFSINYGEIFVDPNLRVGMSVQEGQVIGSVVTVLRKDKGRPMTMLHLEKYSTTACRPITEWALGQHKPGYLLDPTETLLKYLR